MIKETIVVEGRDDETAVLAAVEANIICTHGYGINQDILDLIEGAYKKTGIIIFTDPDHAGQKIRERLTKLFPDAKQAYLTKNQAFKEGDIGIENAVPSDIQRALEAACAEHSENNDPLSMSDLIELGLSGQEDSAERRAKAGAILGIGSGNAKTFLKRLNFMMISKKELYDIFKS